MGKREKPKKPPKAPDLTETQRNQLHNKLTSLVCSEPWHDHCYSEILNGAVRHKTQQARELHRVGVYPPGGDETLMVQCRDCGQLHPPQTVAAGVCGPCNEERRRSGAMIEDKPGVGTTESPLGAAWDALERTGKRLKESRLASEEIGELRRQVERYLAEKTIRNIPMNFQGGRPRTADQRENVWETKHGREQ